MRGRVKFRGSTGEPSSAGAGALCTVKGGHADVEKRPPLVGTRHAPDPGAYCEAIISSTPHDTEKEGQRRAVGPQFIDGGRGSEGASARLSEQRSWDRML